MKLALIDDPRNCNECPLYSHHYCWYTQREPEDPQKVAEWCELTDMIEKKKEVKRTTLSNGFNIDDLKINYVAGWNDAIDTIWGEK